MHSNEDLYLESFQGYMKRWNQALTGVSARDLFTIVDFLIELQERKGTLFIAGNGGSASTAEHFAVDIGIGSFMRGTGIKAIPLTVSTSQLTAFSNDFNYTDYFALTLRQFNPNPSDALLVFTASGESANIIQVLKEARALGMTTCSFTGFLGGESKLLASINVHVPTRVGEYGITEDIHLLLAHFITEAFRKKFSGYSKEHR